jgi:hypothetical protein
MTSTTARIITIALATLALAAPVAAAAPIRDNGDIRTSSLAGTTSEPKVDMRNPDQIAPAPPATPEQQPATMKPVVIVHSQPVADSDGPSPFVYIIPSLVLVAMLAAGFGYSRLSRRPARV